MVPPRERKTISGWCAIIIHVIGFLFISIAMFTRSWIQAESKAYGTGMERLGLWWQCFRSFTVNKDIYNERFFVGCRWIFDRFTTHYEEVREQLAEPFFVSVQVFYTFCFMASLFAFFMSGILVLCPGEKFERKVIKFSYISTAIAFFTGFIAVAVFGAMAPHASWMPHQDHNLLSWSYAIEFIHFYLVGCLASRLQGTTGVVAEFAAAILFYVEFQIQMRKKSYRDAHGVPVALEQAKA